MAKLRSPNYPNYDLDGALILIDKVFAKDGRNKVSRLALATRLGHDGLSGPALGKIGALRAYGLLDGSGDELRVSDDAMAALKAPQGSQQRADAVNRLATKPPLFQMIQKDFPTVPSRENLVFWLLQKGFSDTSAAIAANSYLETMRLVASLQGVYPIAKTQGAEISTNPPPPRMPSSEARQSKFVDGERELTTGLLSKEASFRLIVRGPVGVKEIERLIQKLELDKEILASDVPLSSEAFEQGGRVGNL